MLLNLRRDSLTSIPTMEDQRTATDVDLYYILYLRNLIFIIKIRINIRRKSKPLLSYVDTNLDKRVTNTC